jgi:transposase-like protein
VIQRGGQVVLHMLSNVQQATIKPVIAATVAKGSLIYTDEYNIYARLLSLSKGRLGLSAQERLSRTGRICP